MFILQYQHHRIQEIYRSFSSTFESNTSRGLIVPAFRVISIGDLFHRMKGLECAVDHLP
jgi:hypothetical protein